MQELVRQFGLDWKLLLAQVVNFLILLYVLKRFAYAPLIAMLNKRRIAIEEGVRASELAKKRLADATTTRDEIMLKAEAASLDIVSQAEDIAKTQAQTILESAEQKGNHIIAASRKKIEEDRLKLEEDVLEHAVSFIKQGLVATIGRMHPTERDEVLIKDALRALTTIK
jgi:F-type H+-transporting ATPase subunit b